MHFRRLGDPDRSSTLSIVQRSIFAEEAGYIPVPHTPRARRKRGLPSIDARRSISRRGLRNSPSDPCRTVFILVPAVCRGSTDRDHASNPLFFSNGDLGPCGSILRGPLLTGPTRRIPPLSLIRFTRPHVADRIFLTCISLAPAQQAILEIQLDTR